MCNKQNLLDKLELLIKKYEKNDYILKRLTNYIDNLLPASLEAYEKTQIERNKRKEDLVQNTDEFAKVFLLKNQFYYCSQNELFINYDGNNFKPISEDNILHDILTQITAAPNLRPWKQRIKNTIIKRIKERSPLVSIPESKTIQRILNLLSPKIFSSRNHAKYFLTIIGDCLTGNIDNKIVYIVSKNLKELVREIGVQIYTHFGTNSSLNCIKFKHYDHDFASSRLLSMERKENVSKEIISDLCKYALDILCVASYYSNRYGNADKFLQKCANTTLVEHALYLQKNTHVSIVDSFLKECIHNCESGNIKIRSMIFIWKKWLEKKHVPNIIFYDTLNTLLKKKLQFDEKSESYQNVSSLHLPVVASFLQFWDSHMSDDLFESELEIDEISTLFKKWAGKNFSGVEDAFLIELIRHFYPEVGIDEDKYILNIKCSLWDKRQEVLDCLDVVKMSSDKEGQHKSLYEIYQFYSQKKDFVVSKRYFEKIAKEIIGDNIDKDGLISGKWFDS
tara:strand:- start:62 stop:1582 length:1521 start_codon:yes stop_codon:yes gene_type:complete